MPQVTKAMEEENPVEYWLNIIANYENEFREWERRAEKVIARYRDEYKDITRDSNSKFNIFLTSSV